ncbi:Protein of unknown function [Gryllus bimaculatus]|nr:Protein of unknown function [Gryllus bimaculatus]
MAKSRGSGVNMEKLPMLRVSHCQTALFGKRGGGSGGGGLTAGTSSREERSEAAETRQRWSLMYKEVGKKATMLLGVVCDIVLVMDERIPGIDAYAECRRGLYLLVIVLLSNWLGTGYKIVKYLKPP